MTQVQGSRCWAPRFDADENETVSSRFIERGYVEELHHLRECYAYGEIVTVAPADSIDGGPRFVSVHDEQSSILCVQVHPIHLTKEIAMISVSFWSFLTGLILGYFV